MVSVVILAKNEEEMIGKCIDSVRWADEVLVIDDFSSDKTADIARERGAKVFRHALSNDFARQRNLALQKVKHDWVFFLDADERVSNSLQYEINSAIHDSLNVVQGYYIKRLDTLWGQKIHHGEAGNTVLLRLARKNSGKWKGDVHETWHVAGRKEKLSHHLDHYPHQNLKSFLEEVNFYSTLRGNELYKKRKKTGVSQIIFYPSGKFILNYIFKLGFLDGMPGLLIAFMMSFHSFLVRGKLWTLQSHAKK